jgi:hypothetical protein
MERVYEGAMERVELLRAEWERLDRPLLAKGSKGQAVAHPILRALQAAECHADHLRRGLLPPARMGRPPVAVPGPPSRGCMRLRSMTTGSRERRSRLRVRAARSLSVRGEVGVIPDLPLSRSRVHVGLWRVRECFDTGVSEPTTTT